MKVSATSLPEVKLIEPDVFGDARGFFYESWNARAFAAAGIEADFVQDNHSRSMQGVLRGLHYQLRQPQGKLVRVIANQGLSAPDGVAVGGGSVWVADQATSGVTQIDEASGRVVTTKTDANASYGFWHPTLMISTGPNIYVATPLGTSPMVTKVSTASAKPYWFMCNTNGPYYFSVLSAFAITGNNLWVASQTGANSKTPGAAHGALTELQLGSGALVRTLPTH